MPGCLIVAVSGRGREGEIAVKSSTNQIAGGAPPAAPAWLGPMTDVRNPKLLIAIASAVFAAALAAIVSLLFLHNILKSQPRTIAAAASYRLGEALSLADWASSGGPGQELYVVGFPTCPYCAAFKKTELKRLLAAGIEVRAIEFAPRRMDGANVQEEAAAADVSRTRSWVAYMSPTEAHFGMASDDLGYVERGRATVATIGDALNASRAELGFPAFFWKRPGKTGEEWRYIIGSTPEGTNNMLKELRSRAAS